MSSPRPEGAPLKVLLVSLFHPELVRGGAQQICYELFEGLKAKEGVEPTLLASIDPSLPALYKSGARITGFDGREGEYLFLSQEYDYWWHRTSNALLLESYAEFLRMIDPESLVDEDHPVRALWDFLGRLDLSPFCEGIKAVQGKPGGDCSDPQVLMALWLCALRRCEKINQLSS